MPEISRPSYRHVKTFHSSMYKEYCTANHTGETGLFIGHQNIVHHKYSMTLVSV